MYRDSVPPGKKKTAARQTRGVQVKRYDYFSVSERKNGNGCILLPGPDGSRKILRAGIGFAIPTNSKIKLKEAPI